VPWDTGSEIKNKKIANYQAVVPTTWNISPLDDKGQHGPIEQALIGTKLRTRKIPLKSSVSSAPSTPVSPVPSTSLLPKVESSVDSG